MGIKRRSMFNPKFKRSRPKRWQMGQDLTTDKSNSEVIELVKEETTEEQILKTDEIVEEMVKEVEELVKQVDTPTYKTFELKKKKKAELLEIANDLNCSVTIKNTKAQIIKAIEKQSA